MDISHRIHARKVVLSYFYQRYFFLLAANDDTLIKESLGIAQTFPDHEDFNEQHDLLVGLLRDYNHENPDDVIDYLSDHVFDKWKDQIDIEYVVKMMASFDLYHATVAELVDAHATTFSFAKMDTIDKALFVLWYAEYKVLNTPKEIIINEVVELAKRYADDGSAKLLNGILHKMIGSID